MTRKEERLKYAKSFQGKGMENEELKEIIRLAVLDGATWADKTAWKDAEGEDFPDIDKEVIALEALDEEPNYRVIFAHRVDPNRIIKTSIDGKMFKPSRFGKAGWNLPNLKYWLDLDLPNKNE